jgi:hypothetical protein
MIFPPIELPQYIVVPPTDCEMKDIIGYHNKHLTGKISNYTSFFEKCGYLLSAMYLQNICPLKSTDTVNIYAELTDHQNQGMSQISLSVEYSTSQLDVKPGLWHQGIHIQRIAHPFSRPPITFFTMPVR